MVDRANNSFQDVSITFLQIVPPHSRPQVWWPPCRLDYALEIEARSIKAGIDDARFPLSVLSACILSGEHETALEQGKALLASSGEWKVGYHRSMLLCLISAAAFGKGDLEQGRLHLKDFLQSKEPPADEIHHLAHHFETLGLPEQERQVLEFGRQKHPEYRPILEELVRRGLARQITPPFQKIFAPCLSSRKMLIYCRNVSCDVGDQFLSC